MPRSGHFSHSPSVTLLSISTRYALTPLLPPPALGEEEMKMKAHKKALEEEGTLQMLLAATRRGQINYLKAPTILFHSTIGNVGMNYWLFFANSSHSSLKPHSAGTCEMCKIGLAAVYSCSYENSSGLPKKVVDKTAQIHQNFCVVLQHLLIYILRLQQRSFNLPTYCDWLYIWTLLFFYPTFWPVRQQEEHQKRLTAAVAAAAKKFPFFFFHLTFSLHRLLSRYFHFLLSKQSLPKKGYISRGEEEVATGDCNSRQKEDFGNKWKFKLRLASRQSPSAG